jgi:hypothetical protein
MGFFSFLKKIFEGPTEQAEVVHEKIDFSEIEKVVNKKSKELEAKEAEVVSIIKNRIANFTKELKEKIKIAESVEIESKEKNDKIKSAVYEGRKKYVEFLERFMENIEDIEETNSLKKVMEKIDLAFTRLNESSGKSYERATILIGKEMGNIKESLKNLSNEILSIFNENKSILPASESISIIKLKLNEDKEIKEKIKEIDLEIINLNNKIIQKGRETKEILIRIEDLKNSPKYMENLEKEKLIQAKEKEVEKSISDLKQLINFKALSNFFHIFEDKMMIVKLYRDNFSGEFKKDNGDNILNLLNESKLNTEQISNLAKLILDKEGEIKDIKSTVKKDEIQPVALELEKTNEEAQGFINELGWAEKNKEKMEITKGEILKLIKAKLISINVDLKED